MSKTFVATVLTYLAESNAPVLMIRDWLENWGKRENDTGCSSLLAIRANYRWYASFHKDIEERWNLQSYRPDLCHIGYPELIENILTPRYKDPHWCTGVIVHDANIFVLPSTPYGHPEVLEFLKKWDSKIGKKKDSLNIMDKLNEGETNDIEQPNELGKTFPGNILKDDGWDPWGLKQRTNNN